MAKLIDKRPEADQQWSPGAENNSRGKGNLGGNDLNVLYLVCGGPYQVYKFNRTNQNINFKCMYFIASKLKTSIKLIYRIFLLKESVLRFCLLKVQTQAKDIYPPKLRHSRMLTTTICIKAEQLAISMNQNTTF